jgi:hypothetical protein
MKVLFVYTLFWVLKSNYHIFLSIFVVDKEGVKLFIKE